MVTFDTLATFISVILGTGVIVWRISRIADELKSMISEIDKKVAVIETKTINVSNDHDTLVLVNQMAEAAHRRIDLISDKRASNE